MRYVPRYVINVTADVCKHLGQTESQAAIAFLAIDLAQHSNFMHPCPLEVRLSVIDYSWILVNVNIKYCHFLIAYIVNGAGTFVHKESHVWPCVRTGAAARGHRLFIVGGL